MSRATFLLLCLLNPTLMLCVRAESVEERFLQGLRERHLFRLADVYGTERWDRDDLSDRDRVELAIQLALVYTDQALASPPAERAPLWAKAEGICTALLDGWPDNPRRQLANVQLALVSLARGQQLREESTGTSNESVALAKAREHLRNAARSLAESAEAVDKELIERRMRPSAGSANALSVSELESLSANIAYQLARAQRQLGLCYAARTADRDDALLQALQRLETLTQQTEADELAWSARLEAAACQRELGQLQQAWRRLDDWSDDDPPPDVAARLATERVRLLLAGGKIEAARQLADQAIAETTAANADLALAHLEASLAAWKEASRGGGAGRTDELTTEVAAISRRYGPYWARKAQLTVGRALAGAAPTGNAAAVLLAAKNLYLNGQTAEALAAYDQAVSLLERSHQEEEAFAAAMTAAAIERQASQLAEAARRYRQLSVSRSRGARAAEAHRLAILCVADLLRKQAADGSASWTTAYEELLREHLDHWPRGPTADDARWWLGRLLAGRRDWAAARKALQQIAPGSEHFQGAVYLVVECYEHELERLQGHNGTAGRERSELLAQATDYLQPIVARMRNRPPHEWTELERFSVLSLAQLHLQYGKKTSTFSADLLGRVIRSLAAAQDNQAESQVDPVWQQKVVSLYIVALVRLDRTEQARGLLQWQAKNAPNSLAETLDRLRERAPGEGPALSRETAALVLEGFELLGPQWNSLDESAEQRLKRLRAAALAAAGKRNAAHAEYAELARQSPDDGKVQESYAALLAQSESPAELQEALTRWHEVEQRSHSGGQRWRRARQARIELLGRLGQRDEADKLLRLTRLLYPDWDRRAAD